MDRKTCMVAKIYGNGTWRVIWENGKTLPYAVKHTGFNPLTGKDETHTVVRYATERSCLYYIADRIMR